ncbi:hypothetical protein GUITHDRAFT_91839 [Guillardia theta CCMP2712]|uniref:C-8 sterol isomerase n=1 Tax=Guillardia theta (strain CCMP2712) TaxID=905079 RepID=L1JYU7_GUITC|nr:hypothetical protein GUITHDRAFT_91839 [Guillardia theta CCMP2712]EKX53547.1 hypothetical protein GUITHDRAFT_91839 [Guillardia theta CCMP2712]|eukprot:XP_005840527.1 hypothetical protein GUITHDRAFT_91839 [Guillardia theta CCMP2712]
MARILLVSTIVLVLAIAVPFLTPKTVFDEKKLAEIARKALAKESKNATRIINNVIDLMRKEYPDYIEKGDKWLFNNAGGAMGSMTVLHASFSEYVIIFGSAIGTEGHTGRFLADDWFTILYGEQWAYKAGAIEREVYKPGDQHHLPFGVAKGYRMPEACWALEYARGNILSMMPFGIFDTFSSTLDLWTLWETVEVSGTQMIKNLLRGKI